MTRYLLDTVILIDHLNGLQKATKWLLQVKASAEAVISVITRAEVLAGGDEARRVEVLSLLDEWHCLPLTLEVADLAASMRRQYRWKLPDAFQAALARHHGLFLATRNTRDFPPDRHEFVRVPYRLSE